MEHINKEDLINFKLYPETILLALIYNRALANDRKRIGREMRHALTHRSADSALEVLV